MNDVYKYGSYGALLMLTMAQDVQATWLMEFSHDVQFRSAERRDKSGHLSGSLHCVGASIERHKEKP